MIICLIADVLFNFIVYAGINLVVFITFHTLYATEERFIILEKDFLAYANFTDCPDTGWFKFCVIFLMCPWYMYRVVRAIRLQENYNLTHSALEELIS